MGDAGHFEGALAGFRGGRDGQVRHFRNLGVGQGFALTEQPDRRPVEGFGDIGADHDNRAAAVGEQAAVEAAQGAGDHPGVQDLVAGERFAAIGLGVEARPGAGGDRQVGELLGRGAEFGEMARGGQRIGADRGRQAIGRLKLVAEVVADLEDILVLLRTLGAAVQDHGDLAEPGLDGRGRMAEMELEGCAADRGGVGVFGLDAQILANLQLGQAAPGARDEDPVHIGFLEPRVGERRGEGLGLERENS